MVEGGAEAHCLHKHALLRNSIGMRASDAGLKVAVLHQQSTSNLPCFAAAQSFGWPHKGQVWFGNAIIMVPFVAQCLTY
jgi:hypothetical protein